MDLDYCIMLQLVEIELKLNELEESHGKRYFKEDNIRQWSFKCHHCNKRISSSEADKYWINSMPWGHSLTTRRFCSIQCSDICYREQENELLKQQEEFIEDRRLLGKFYREAERKFKEFSHKRE